MPWLVSMTNGNTLSRFGEFTRSTSAPCSASVRPFVGPGEDSSEVEHTHTVERASGAAHRLGRGLPDLLDLDARERTDGSTLRVLGPFVARAHHRAAGPRLCERVLERLCLPLRDTGGDGCGVSALGDAEHAPSRIGEPRERSVQVHPASVAALVQRDQRIVGHALRRLRRRAAAGRRSSAATTPALLVSTVTVCSTPVLSRQISAAPWPRPRRARQPPTMRRGSGSRRPDRSPRS